MDNMPSAGDALQNKRIVFRSRPGVNGVPTESNFAVENCSYPEIPDGHVLLKTLYLSVDPALRCRMNEVTGAHYLSPWQIGECIEGLGGIGIVVESNVTTLRKGEIVCRAMSWPWQLLFTAHADSLQKIDQTVVGDRLSLILSCLGLIGLTALLGIREKGGIKPGTNQTCVVSGAAGACGTLAGQLAKLEGCSRVVGICGGPEKCKFLVDDLKLDAAIDYKSEGSLEDKIKEACPSGVQVYFDNVGGAVSNAVIKNMTEQSNIVLCGQIATYNSDVPYPPPLPSDVEKIMAERKIKRERFLVLNYADKFDDSLKDLAKLLREGKLIVRETIEEGLENTPKSFVNMMNGGNIGKQLVHVSDP